MHQIIPSYFQYVLILVAMTIPQFDLRADWSDLLEEAGKQAISNKIDKKATIERMKVVERYGNKIIVDVSYKRIYKPTDVEIEAYVLKGGSELDGFESTLADIEDKKGKVRLTLTLSNPAFDSVRQSDQIKIVLSRDGSSIKSKSFDLCKDWTAITEPEVDPSCSSRESIELAENITTTEVGNEDDGEIAEETANNTQPGSGKKTYEYTVRTQRKVRRSGTVKAAGVAWNCQANSNKCTASAPWSKPNYRSCHALSKQVGKISYYGYPNNRLSSKHIRLCNDPQIRRRPANIKYTAKTKTKVRRSGNIKAGAVTWNCKKNSNFCTASGPWPNPSYRACGQLARIVGDIKYYGYPKKILSADQLRLCNKKQISRIPNNNKPRNYRYTVRTKEKVSRSGIRKASGVSWNCKANTYVCYATGPWPKPSLTACKALAKQVGRITYYGYPKKYLSKSDLGKCNSFPRRTVQNSNAKKNNNINRNKSVTVRNRPTLHIK